MSPVDLVEATLGIALKQTGVLEYPIGSNKGPQVDKYLLSTHNPPGVAWCASYVFWCFQQACHEAGLLDSQIPFPCTGYVPTIYAWGEEHNVLYPLPQRGDVFVLVQRIGDAFHYRHTGFVLSAQGSRFATVEGNTNLSGSPEGIGVFRRDRPVGAHYWFVRWKETMEPAVEDHFQLLLGDKPVTEMDVIRGVAWCPVRVLAEALGVPVGWDNDTQTVSINGRPLLDSPMVTKPVAGGLESFAPIRELVKLTGLDLKPDLANKRVVVNWPADHRTPTVAAARPAIRAATRRS